MKALSVTLLAGALAAALILGIARNDPVETGYLVVDASILMAASWVLLTAMYPPRGGLEATACFALCVAFAASLYYIVLHAGDRRSPATTPFAVIMGGCMLSLAVSYLKDRRRNKRDKTSPAPEADHPDE